MIRVPVPELDQALTPGMVENLSAANLPFVIKQGVPPCAALEKWSLDYFQQQLDTSKEVMVRAPAAAPDSGYRYIQRRFQEVLDDWRSGAASRFYMAGFGDQLPELEHDIPLPGFLTGTNRHPVFKQLWMGVRGFTPFHFHPAKHAFVLQLVGKRKFTLVCHKDTPNMHPEPWYSSKVNTSKIAYPSLEQVTVSEFPGWEKVTGYEYELEAGDLLYIPPQWWHFVAVEDFSAMCSYFWFGRPSAWWRSGNALRTLVAIMRRDPGYFVRESVARLAPRKAT